MPGTAEGDAGAAGADCARAGVAAKAIAETEARKSFFISCS